MNIAARRRLAVGVLATTSALVAGLVVAPAASAANITSVSPTFAVNNDPSEVITFTTETQFPPGSRVTMTRVGTSGATADTLTATVTGNGSPTGTQPTAEFNFLDSGNGDDDGPANAGVYNVTITQPDPSTASDSCQSCFTVIASSTPPRVTGATPNNLRAGQTGNVTLAGSGFTRDTRIEVLLPGTTTVDPNVNPNAAPTRTGTPDECLMEGEGPGCTLTIDDDRTTPTQLLRSFVVQVGASAGVRDLRVVNPDGSTSPVCSGCFTVNGAALTGVSPNVASNAETGTVRITFSGPNVPNSGTPVLNFVGRGRGTGSGGSASKESLRLTGTNATFGSGSVSADFAFRNAAPGSEAYQPALLQADGSSNVCTCFFSVAQPQRAEVSSVVPASARQSDSRTVTIRGTGFSRGVEFLFPPADQSATTSGGITVNAVRVNDAGTEASVDITVAANAAVGKRDVYARTTDGFVGSACADCFEVTAGASASPTATQTASPTSSPPAAQDGRFIGRDNPVRVLETRDRRGIDGPVGTTAGKKRGQVVVDLSEQVGNDSGATAAVLNVTATEPDGAGFVVVYPASQSRPPTSNVNYAPGATPVVSQANEVIVALPADHRVVIEPVNAATHLVVDFLGHFTTTSGQGGRVQLLDTPSRQFDRRVNGEVDVQLQNVPAGATAALLNVTAAGLDVPNVANAPAYVVAYPAGTSDPGTSNVNLSEGQTQANEVLTRIGTGDDAGQVRLKLSRGTARLIVDVVGFVVPTSSSGQVFTPLTRPERVIDSREGEGTSRSRKTASNPATLDLEGSSVPANATGVVLNVTATGALRGDSGFITVYPAGEAQPDTSNVNWQSGRNQANEVISRIGSDRSVTIAVGGQRAGSGTHVVVDVVGFFTAASGSGGGNPLESLLPSSSPSASTSPTPTPTATGTTGSAGAGGSTAVIPLLPSEFAFYQG